MHPLKGGITQKIFKVGQDSLGPFPIPLKNVAHCMDFITVL
jgi:hypothetical protein